MRIKTIKRESKRFKDKHKMRYHSMLGLSRAERYALKQYREKTKNKPAENSTEQER